MKFDIYFSPNMEGMDEFLSYEINTPDNLLNILTSAWEELSSLYDIDDANSEAFIVAHIPGNNPIEITIASFALIDGELSIQNTEFYEPNGIDALNWKKVGLSLEKPYIGEDGLNMILQTIFDYQNSLSR